MKNSEPLKRRLEKWSIFIWAGKQRAIGILRGGDHPNGWAHEGRRVITSPIGSGPTKTDSSPPITTIQTLSGTIYELGEPE